MSETKASQFENGYIEGQRAVFLRMLCEALIGLGKNSEEWKQHNWLLEREEAIATCRSICSINDDNEWPDDLHLADIISKHVTPAVRGGER